MIRNLKVLLAAAMALAAVGVFSASAAQAHTPGKFTCAKTPCAATIELDGTSTTATAHHVFVIKNSIGESVSITAGQLTGYATSAVSPTESLTFTNLAYHHVTANGQAAAVHMNGCKFAIKTANSAVAPHDLGSVTIENCDPGKHIDITIPGTGCTVTITEQGPLSGLTFHTPVSGQVTATAKVPNIQVHLDNALGGACLIDETKTPITSEYTTGNVIVQGYEDPSGGDTHNGVKVNVGFNPTVT